MKYEINAFWDIVFSALVIAGATEASNSAVKIFKYAKDALGDLAGRP